jgi:4-diphosphocytidyl-2-C-methyl-D-erythritol kinase
VIEAQAPAKINLALAVIGRRADGFHQLVSVFIRAGLADRLAVEVATTRPSIDRLTVEGAPRSRVHGVDSVLMAIDLLRRHAGRPLPPLDIVLEKHIPYAAGLAGGSSDGAAAIELAAEAWGLALSDGERLDLAARLGSDVPFFAAHAAVALIEGRGERITALPPAHGAPAALLATSEEGISTTDVFAALDAAATSLPSSGAAATAFELAAALAAGLDAEALAGWAARLRDANDLWAAAVGLRPELRVRRDTLEAALEQPILMSGSGPTLLALYPSLEAAEAGRLGLAGRTDLRGLRLTATPIGNAQHREAR